MTETFENISFIRISCVSRNSSTITFIKIYRSISEILSIFNFIELDFSFWKFISNQNLLRNSELISFQFDQTCLHNLIICILSDLNAWFRIHEHRNRMIEIGKVINFQFHHNWLIHLKIFFYQTWLCDWKQTSFLFYKNWLFEIE